MWSAIIMAIVGIATASIQAGVDSKQRREAGEEAQRLSGIARQDYLNQRSEEELALSKEAALGREGLAFKRQQIADQEADFAKQRRDATMQQRQKNFANAGERLTSQTVDSIENRVLESKRWL
jgi:hypothetical protein